MKTAVAILIAMTVAFAVPAVSLATEGEHHDEQECVTLFGVPHNNWETVVCDEQVVLVENPGGQITFEAPFEDFD